MGKWLDTILLEVCFILLDLTVNIGLVPGVFCIGLKHLFYAFIYIYFFLLIRKLTKLLLLFSLIS